ncbi:hypothetical protein BC829DRAFT_390835 [Chytridium lagenaria]|nr:hypothetical protein BC829DRAFT_390835 [Chytridium lagenaria]
MASIEDLSTEIGFRVAVYIVPSQVEILSKVSKRFNANWSFFNDFASCMVYLKNHGYLTVTNIFFQLHSATLLAARIVMDDYKTYSLYHCSKDVCCYRLKGDRRDLGTPCIRHSRKMAEALRIAVANGFPDELLRSIPKILIHNNLLHTIECMLEAVTWNNVEDMVFLFAVGNLEEKIPEMVGRAVSLGQVEVLHALFELDAMNPETAERVYTINMVNGDDMMDLALTHPKLTLGVILMHSLSKRTDELYERVFNALVHQGNILQLQSMLEWFIPKDCFIDYTSTVKMLNFVTTLPSVKIDTHTFVLQCCKKINIPVLLDFGKRRPDKLANIVSSILQSPNSDTIILDQRIPVSWREALVRHSLKLPSCLVSRRLGRALDSVIQAGGLNISEDEKKHACFRAVFDEAKNRALCRAFERCDVKAVFSLLTDPNRQGPTLFLSSIFFCVHGQENVRGFQCFSTAHSTTHERYYDNLKYLLRSWCRRKFARMFRNALDLGWIGVGIIADLLTYTLIDVKPEILAAVEWVCDHHLEMPVSNDERGELKLQSWMSLGQSRRIEDLGVHSHATAAGYASYATPLRHLSSVYQGRQGWSLPD